MMNRFSVDPDISRAKTIDSSIYTSQQLFHEMEEKIFSSCWHFIGDTALVNQSNNCYPFTLLAGYLNEPLLLTKDETGKIHCLSNVCTHRGNLLIYEPCRSNNLRCKYHGRSFQLDGKFRSMPEFREVKDFPAADDDLHSLPLFHWGHFLFTTWDKLENNPASYTSQLMAKQYLEEPLPASYDLPTSMSDENVIRSLLQDTGFSKLFIEKVKLFSASPSAKEAALGFVEGGSDYDEIRKRKPGSIDEIKIKLEKELADQLGDEPMTVPISALISQAWK